MSDKSESLSPSMSLRLTILRSVYRPQACSDMYRHMKQESPSHLREFELGFRVVYLCPLAYEEAGCPGRIAFEYVWGHTHAHTHMHTLSHMVHRNYTNELKTFLDCNIVYYYCNHAFRTRCRPFPRSTNRLSSVCLSNRSETKSSE